MLSVCFVWKTNVISLKPSRRKNSVKYSMGRQPRQDMNIFWTFRGLSPSPSSGCFKWLTASTSNTLKMETELVPETSKTFTSWRGCAPEKISDNAWKGKQTLFFEWEDFYTNAVSANNPVIRVMWTRSVVILAMWTKKTVIGRVNTTL